MNIVVLDGYTLNPGDLSWKELKAIGPCAIYERTAPGEIIARALNAEILLTNKAELTRQQLQNLPRLKYVGVLATGTNCVDLEAARERNIVVTNVPAYGTNSVAQTTIALLLELTQHAGHHAQTVREGQWTQNPDWCYWSHPLIELDGLTMGVVGFGRIGQAVSKLAAAFGMQVLALSHTPKAAPNFVRFTNLETIFRESDVVSLHCPLTPETKNLVNAQRLAWMKPTAFLVNTSRGQLIDEPAVAAALNSARIAGAGLDVLSTEPPQADNPLLQAQNCIITPHLAWATRAARSRLMAIVVENVRSFLQGKTQNVVGCL
jgi:glycerate dehydrogenase